MMVVSVVLKELLPWLVGQGSGVLAGDGSYWTVSVNVVVALVAALLLAPVTVMV
jgi:hypothetical protein